VKKALVFFALLVLIFTRIAAQEEDALILENDSIFDEPLFENQEKNNPNSDANSFFGEPLSETEGKDIFDWDIDSLFDKPFSETEEEENTDDPVSSVLGSVKRRGIIFGASYEFQGLIAPGWDTAPWFFDGSEVYSWGPGVKMNSTLSLDAQISDVFRVLTVFSFTIPSFAFTLGDFFFDYNFLNTAFIRAGKYEQSWGVSPNYGFTNLLARVPSGKDYGTSYIFKADIPVGIGGIQMLALTRAKLMEGILPGMDDIGYGWKYNLAFRWADFDLGMFYQENMALRSFLSIKTTVLNTELYNEWLVAANIHSDYKVSFAANVGFIKNFFSEKFIINGEFFYNGEKGTEYYRPETNLLEEETLPYIENIDLALNLLYKFGGKGNPSVFTQVRYAPMQSSAQVVPGFRLTPFSHVEVYLAVPMALGGKSGYYYLNNSPGNRPFSIMLLVTLKGNVQARYNY